MEKVLRLTTWEELRAEKQKLHYWLSRPPEERIAEVERLRQEYMAVFQREWPEGALRGSLRLVERPKR